MDRTEPIGFLKRSPGHPSKKNNKTKNNKIS